MGEPEGAMSSQTASLEGEGADCRLRTIGWSFELVKSQGYLLATTSVLLPPPAEPGTIPGRPSERVLPPSGFNVALTARLWCTSLRGLPH